MKSSDNSARHAARLAAVQALYQMEISGEEADEIIVRVRQQVRAKFKSPSLLFCVGGGVHVVNVYTIACQSS